MQSENIIINSIKDSFISIWKHKSLFLLLLILQIIFFAAFSYVSWTYQKRILENAKSIIDYLEQQQLDDASFVSNLMQQKNILGDDPLLISRHFNEIVKNFRLYLMYFFILLALSTAISWTMTFRMINKKINKKKFSYVKIFFQMVIVLLFYLGLIFSFFYLLFNISLTEIAQGTELLKRYIPFLPISSALVYFMFISMSLVYSTELKRIVQKTLVIGIKKIHYVLAAYVINILIFGISIYLLYYFIEGNLLILLLSVMLMAFSFVFGRILMVNVVDRLKKIV